MCNQATFLSREDCAGIRDPGLGLSLKSVGGGRGWWMGKAAETLVRQYIVFTAAL